MNELFLAGYGYCRCADSTVPAAGEPPSALAVVVLVAVGFALFFGLALLFERALRLQREERRGDDKS